MFLEERPPAAQKAKKMDGSAAVRNEMNGIQNPYVGKSTQAICQQILEANCARLPAVVLSCMARVDGVAFASAKSAMAKVDAQRSSAIVSSLLALSESFSQEVLRSKCLYTTIATEHGSIITVRVPCKNKSFALCMCFDNSENLAMALRAALSIADSLAAAVDAG